MMRQSVLGTIARWPLRLIPKGTVVPVLTGSLRGSRWTVGSGTHGCWLGTYELSKQRAFSDAIRQESIVFDIGANCGFYTLLAAKRCGRDGRVFAFEPMPSNLAILRQHVALNRLANVLVLPMAVSAECGHARFATQLGSEFGRLEETGDTIVETASLDQLRSTSILPRPDVMKIDVEGAEGAVLRGARNLLNEDHPDVFLAVHGTSRLHECLPLLQQAWYVCHVESSGDGLYEVFASRRTSTSK